MEKQERQVKGIWIPIEIWKDDNLSWNEKILFLEIDSFTSEDVDFYISNEYIAKLLNVGETTANKILSSLIQKGYVIKTRFDGRRRYVKSALHFTTRQGCTKVQGCIVENDNPRIIYNNTDSLPIQSNKTNNKEENILKEKENALFEECWKAYRRKGSKGKSKPYWDKLTSDEKELVLPHIRAYVSSRDVNYQKDFERYLRDKIFNDVVYKGGDMIYDPSKGASNEYNPIVGGNLVWNDYFKKFIFLGMFTDQIYDGYDDENRPDGAEVMLNNGRGTLAWKSETKKWEKKL